jgi:hypothetical protein
MRLILLPDIPSAPHWRYYDAGGAILLLPTPSPRLALTGQCDFHELLMEGVEILVGIKPATPRRFPIFNPSSFTQAALMFERCT